MKIINVHKLQLQFDSNGQPPDEQVRQVIVRINIVLERYRWAFGSPQLIVHPDEIEIEETET